MKSYHDLLEDIAINGKDRSDRTGTGTRSVFGRQIRFNLQDGFPILTTKRVPFKLIVAELLWFLEGSTNNNRLAELSGCPPEITIWAEWATRGGALGPIYGEQWRSWACPDGETIDQIAEVIAQIKADPDSRRLIVSGWNPAVLPQAGLSPQQNAMAGRQALPPCHTLFQFYVESGQLSCQLYQRSADAFLGVPFNIASYALLTHLVASHTGLRVGEFIHTFGDLHIYHNHYAAVHEILKREPRALPALQFNPNRETIFDHEVSEFSLIGYDPCPAIPAPVAV